MDLNDKKTSILIHALAQKKPFLILGLGILLWFPTLVFSSSPVILKTHPQKYALGAHLEILEDPAAQWIFDEITRPELDQKFTLSQEENPNYGFTKSAYWVKLQLKNALKTKKECLLEIDYPLLDEIKYFESSEFSNTVWIRKETGDLLPFHRRDVAHRNFVFRVTLQPQEVKTIYLRLTTEGSMQFPITLWDPISFTEMVNKTQYGFGLYYGIFLSMSLYNLFLFLAVRDTTYLHYVSYIISLAFTQMALNSLFFQFI